MNEEELKRLRPQARWSESSDMYQESIVGCEPFVTSASYEFSRWRGLSRIHLWREWEVSATEELESIVPGFLHGCREMWGTPEGVEVFTRPKWTGRESWNVGMWWHRPGMDIYAFYSSPRALFPVGTRWLATIDLQFSQRGIPEFREWTNGDTRAATVAKHFPGFPTDTRDRGETFH
jgi:hypothetical protein